MPRGKKSCPKCNALVGPRLRVCECGYEFTFKQTVVEPEPTRQALRVPPRVPPQPRSDIVTVTDWKDLRAFMQQLRACFFRAGADKPVHTATLKHADGILHVEICSSIRR